MSKILFVENFSLTRDNPMSTCYILRCKTIINDNRFDFYDISTDMIDVSKYDTVIFGNRAYPTYKPYKPAMQKIIAEKMETLSKIKNKFLLIQDMHPKTYGNISNFCEYLNTNHINIIFTFFNNIEAKMIRSATPDVKHFYLPLHIDTNIFHDLKLEKKYDILLYGSIHPRHYPFRKRLFELLLSKRDEFNIYYVPKPEEFNPEVCEDGLAKLINMSKICIATKSRYDYLVGKYFEIIMCKSLVVGDIPTDGSKILKNKIVEIDNKMTDDEILTIIRNNLQNYSQHENTMSELYTYVEKNHSLNTYADSMYHIVTKT